MNLQLNIDNLTHYYQFHQDAVELTSKQRLIVKVSAVAIRILETFIGIVTLDLSYRLFEERPINGSDQKEKPIQGSDQIVSEDEEPPQMEEVNQFQTTEEIKLNEVSQVLSEKLNEYFKSEIDQNSRCNTRVPHRVEVTTNLHNGNFFIYLGTSAQVFTLDATLLENVDSFGCKQLLITGVKSANSMRDERAFEGSSKGWFYIEISLPEDCQEPEDGNWLSFCISKKESEQGIEFTRDGAVYFKIPIEG